ncbi:MAG TPA: IMP cyclohydrolase [Methanothrix sp.]|nr:IMP cyclohydrolase [Methanothrix sp.]
MYIGRIVAVGRSGGRSFAAYRVSSRSFPNRRAEIRGRSILVSPLNPADLARNPYIAYNCIRVLDDTAVVTNGTQTDMIAERIEDWQKPFDAIALCLVAFGYERDELDTPRLAGAVKGEMAYLGIAKRGEIRVKEFRLQEGDALMVATYEKTEFEPVDLSGNSAVSLARGAFDLSFERPVCAAAALELPGPGEPGQKEGEGHEKEGVGSGFELAVYNPM